MEAKTKDLWVFIETEEDGSPKKVGLELLNPVAVWLTNREENWLLL